ncbi:intraflagellar transport protein 27 homolog isoform X2 [Corythoichthys intestinalis]|uniref:intraflagellar transport protein 27 homolog isoform X2 n=1 Tax=Corythoichthys intestinalis TaxID=161448 RepID=UPI0025A60CA3|nr:intraflagellar transport protein 27 homolog isoform X2 [Corythoichthys intestinalis]XP_061791838.1 intraflagellar transport protein 27 homolog [Nerophis lumbriciformis]
MVRLRARCLLVGDPAVGKSALAQMFHSDGTLFQKNYSMTTGVELLIKSVNIPESSDSVELYIIDSAGKESLVEAIEKMWGEPSLVCLVFDLTSERSFGNCSRWMDRVRAHCRGLQVPGVLVGNKCDLSARREVQTTIAQEWAQSEGLEYHETSAKEMENSEVPLLSLARAFHSLYQERRETIQNLRQA